MGWLGDIVNIAGKVVKGAVKVVKAGAKMVKQAKVGKQAIAAGFVAQGTTLNQPYSDVPEEIPWYKQKWFLPTAIGGGILLLFGAIALLSKRKR